MIHELGSILSSRWKGIQRNSLKWRVFIGRKVVQRSNFQKKRKGYFKPGHIFEGKGMARILSCTLPLLPLEGGEGLPGRLSHRCQFKITKWLIMITFLMKAKTEIKLDIESRFEHSFNFLSLTVMKTSFPDLCPLLSFSNLLTY